MKYPLLTASACLLATSVSHAALVWTGAGDGVSLYQEANWLDDNGAVPSANEVNPNTTITAATGGLIEISGGSGSPANYGGEFILPAGVDLTIGNGKTLGSAGGAFVTGGGGGATLSLSGGATLATGAVREFSAIFVDASTIDLIGTAGIAMASGISPIALTNGASVITQFINLGAAITVDGTSSIEFLGGGDPINSQTEAVTVNLFTGGRLIMTSEAEIDEHIGQNEIFVNGIQVTAANRDSLLSFSGGTVTALIPEPSLTLLGSLGILGILRRRR